MNVLRESVEDFEGLTTIRSLQPIELLTSGEPESVLAHGLEVGRMVREGTMPLVEAAAAHHQALARSMRGARDIDECVRRVEAGGSCSTCGRSRSTLGWTTSNDGTELCSSSSRSSSGA
jgi:hypothetical protein